MTVIIPSSSLQLMNRMMVVESRTNRAFRLTILAPLREPVRFV